MSFKAILIAAFTVFVLTNCSDDEIVPQDAAASAEEVALSEEDASGSMTISGVFTSYEDIEDCKTCTYVVPTDASTIDGAELGLKAGAVICLDKAKRYGDVEFVNLEGTEEKPIRIGTAIFNN